MKWKNITAVLWKFVAVWVPGEINTDPAKSENVECCNDLLTSVKLYVSLVLNFNRYLKLLEMELDILEIFRDINMSGSVTLPENPLVGVTHWW